MIKLNYSKEGQVFWFTLDTPDPLVTKIFGIKKVWLNAETPAYTMPSYYPQGLTALKDFKTIFPEAKASKDALSKINDLVNIRDNLGEHNAITKSGHKFVKPPYVHQLDSIEIMLHCYTLALLIDLGLGKTYITLNYLAIENLTEPVKALVLCPKIMRLNWAYENLDYTPNLTCKIYSGTKKKREKLQEELIIKQPNIIITNFEALGKVHSSDFNFFKGLDFTHLIIDEASRVKSHNSQRSKTVQALSRYIDKRFILSGGLTLGSPMDLWMPYNILDSAILGSNYYAFENKYCKRSTYNRHIITGYKNLDVLKSKIGPFSIILNKEDAISLPERTLVKRWIPLTTNQQAMYDEIKSKDAIILDNKIIPTNIAIVKLNKLQQVLSGFINFPIPRENIKCDTCEFVMNCVEDNVFPWQKHCKKFDPAIKKPVVETHNFFAGTEFQPKLAMLREDIEDIENRKEHVIVWVYYRFDFNEVKEALELDGTTFITSDEPGADKKFETGKYTVFLGREAEGIGITLNKASTTIYYSHSLHSEHRMQSMDRNYRIGQKNKTVVIDYVSRGTIEEQILELLNQKKNIRDYVHSRVECKKCSKFVWCFERMVEPYQKHCILYNKRKEAEQVAHIKIGE